MSYLVFVRRTGGIGREDIASLVRDDPSLEFAAAEPAADSAVFVWRETPDAEPFALVLADGEIGTSGTPSNAVLGKLQLIAARLDARVIGEEGEDLTDVDVTAHASRAGCARASALVLLAVAGLIAMTLF